MPNLSAVWLKLKQRKDGVQEHRVCERPQAVGFLDESQNAPEIVGRAGNVTLLCLRFTFGDRQMARFPQASVPSLGRYPGPLGDARSRKHRG
jgi:hypothetical protein